MLEINNLNYSYDGEVKVLDDVTFKIEKGKIYCLLGVNGAGKTTLFNCITGFLNSNLDLDENLINDKILYIQDEMNFYKNLSGIEFIKLIFDLKEKLLDEEKLKILLKDLKMEEKITDTISTYSLGTKQKLVLIIGFLLKYEYIFMDEQFGAIDFISAEYIINLLQKYRDQNNGIIISTHLIDIAHEIADEILFINNGKVYQKRNDFIDTKQLKGWIRRNI
ncbi:ATP-binding cassette domain-containing protein [Clostridium septicum]|uniref:ATP-binding cassette domain-containing protein n=1 Tax=Clostridium septicum TaxID=1504 RepID=UPI00082B80E3|nr:ATP-binding cassette domain-containing protein [Clostridium septicum]